MRPEAPVAVAIVLIGVCLLILGLGASDPTWSTVAENIALVIGAVGVFTVILMLVKDRIRL